MKNGDVPAYPTEVVEKEWAGNLAIPVNKTIFGLTKREALAKAAIQGILAAGDINEFVVGNEVDFAEFAVSCADALLAELERTK